MHQGRLHAALALAGRQLQDAQVLLGGPPGLLHEQHVVGGAEAAAGEQVGLVAVVREGPGLADQPVDDVAVRDLVLAATPQPGQPLDLLLAEPDLDPLGVQAGLHPLADEPARHRVDVARHADGAAGVHTHLQPLARLQPTRRQGLQQGQFLGQASQPPGVALLEELPQEGLVSLAAGKVAAATQQQGLIQGSLELAVALFHVAVLVTLAGLDGLGLQAIVLQQGLVTLLERPGPLDAGLDGGGQAIRAVQVRHAAELPEGVLQPLAEALQALGKANRAGLPVGVGQDEVVDHVLERAAVERHAQVGAMREIAGTQASGVMDLGEEDLLGRALQGPPAFDPPLQGPQLAVGEASGEPTLQVGEEGLGLEPGLEPELFLQAGPDVSEGIGSRQPVPVHDLALTGQPVEAEILASGLGVHAGLGGGQILGLALLHEATELPHLRIGNHPAPPVGLLDDDDRLAKREF